MDHNFTGTDKAAKIAAATDNRHKIAEILSITRLFGMDVIPKSETCAADLEVEETGTTFEENSRIKAEAVMKATGMAAIADDSGLVVDALGGAPGVYSARFSGENATDEKNNEKLLTLMEDVPDENRRAKFVSVITMMYPDGSVLTARGECPGRIVRVRLRSSVPPGRLFRHLRAADRGGKKQHQPQGEGPRESPAAASFGGERFCGGAGSDVSNLRGKTGGDNGSSRSREKNVRDGKGKNGQTSRCGGMTIG